MFRLKLEKVEQSIQSRPIAACPDRDRELDDNPKLEAEFNALVDRMET